MSKHINEQGFTLIEVVVAMAIFAIGIIAIYSMQTTALKGNSKSNSITISSNAIQDKFEEFLGLSYSDAKFTSGDHSDVLNQPVVRQLDWVVVNWSDDLIDNDMDGKTDEFDERGVKNVQLTIQYKDNGIVKSYIMHFLKTEIL